MLNVHTLYNLSPNQMKPWFKPWKKRFDQVNGGEEGRRETIKKRTTTRKSSVTDGVG